MTRAAPNRDFLPDPAPAGRSAAPMPPFHGELTLKPGAGGVDKAAWLPLKRGAAMHQELEAYPKCL